MSTNFDFYPSVDSPLAVYGYLHLGKSDGANFTFQGFDHEGGINYVKVSDSLGIQLDTPRCVIKSFADWKKVLKHGVILRSDAHVLSYDEFIKYANSWKSSSPVLHNDDWLDTEGFKFIGRNFF